MRFFHLSDLHLGIKLYEHDLLKDQKAILDEIVALTRQYQPDAVVFPTISSSLVTHSQSSPAHSAIPA